MYSGLSTAKDGVAAGANIAVQKSSEAVNFVGNQTLETMDWTAENMKKGAGHIYEASYSTGSALRDKLDETGVTDRASQAAESAKVAGGYVLATGAAGVSFVNSKIDENETLSNIKSTASQGAQQAAAAASTAAKQAMSSMTSWFGWGGSSQSAAQPQAAAPEESKGQDEPVG